MGLARVAWAERNGEQAIRLLADWAGANPGDLVVRLECTRYRALSGDFETAQAQLRQLRHEFPDNISDVRLVEAQVLIFSQQREEARNLLESMIAGGESSFQVRRMLAQNDLFHYRHEPDPMIENQMLEGLEDLPNGIIKWDSLIVLGKLEEFRESTKHLPHSNSVKHSVYAAYAQHLEGREAEVNRIWSRYIETTPIPQIWKPEEGELKRLDAHALPEVADEIRVYTVIRNERWRLAWFCDYYRSIGVDRFFFVDNGSTDGSMEWLLEQPDVHVFYTEASYGGAYSGMQWVNALVDRFGRAGWTMYVDVDEAFVFPDIERVGLAGLVKHMEREGSDLVQSFMLDMFTDAPQDLPADGFERNFIRNYPLFENRYDITPSPFCPYVHTSGGVRRIFGHHENLTKTPFIRGGRNIRFLLSSHRVTPGRVSEVRGACLHFKLAGDYQAIFEEDLKNNSRIGYCRIRHQAYVDLLGEDGIDFRSDFTLRYESSETLLEAGLIHGRIQGIPETAGAQGWVKDMRAARLALDYERLASLIERWLSELSSLEAVKPSAFAKKPLSPLLFSIQFQADSARIRSHLEWLHNIIESAATASKAPAIYLARCRLLFALGKREAFLKEFSELPKACKSGDMFRGLEFVAKAWSESTLAANDKVFVIGLSRTGTTTMNRALNVLGLMAVHWQNPIDMKLLTMRDLPMFDAFSDIPISADFEAIYEQYPEARFIFTDRPLESWVRSVQKHYAAEIGVWKPQELEDSRVASRHGGIAVSIDRKIYTNHETWEAAYAAHKKRVHSFFGERPEARFLVFSVFEGHGWEELCGFLECPIPSMPFPHANAAKT